MKNLDKIIAGIILLITVIIYNAQNVPNRIEINRLEIIQVIGLDEEEEDKCTVSVVRNKESQGESDNEISEDDSFVERKILNAEEITFEKALRKVELQTDTKFSRGHIEYLIFGEKTAKNGIANMFDYLAREEHIRLNSKVYICKDISSKEFLEKSMNSNYTMPNKLQSLEESSELNNISQNARVIDVIDTIIKKDAICLIPILKLDSEGKTSDIHIDGLAILKGDSIIGVLNEKQTLNYNFLTNKVKIADIIVKDEFDKTVSLQVINSKTKMDFEFEKEKLKKVKISIDVDSNYEEVHSLKDIFTTEYINQIENKKAEYIKKEIEELIKYSKDLNVDLFDIGEKFKLRHPYKFRNIEKDWNNIYSGTDIEVNVQARIMGTYEVTKLTNL